MHRVTSVKMDEILDYIEADDKLKINSDFEST